MAGQPSPKYFLEHELYQELARGQTPAVAAAAEMVQAGGISDQLVEYTKWYTESCGVTKTSLLTQMI